MWQLRCVGGFRRRLAHMGRLRRRRQHRGGAAAPRQARRPRQRPPIPLAFRRARGWPRRAPRPEARHAHHRLALQRHALRQEQRHHGGHPERGVRVRARAPGTETGGEREAGAGRTVARRRGRAVKEEAASVPCLPRQGRRRLVFPQRRETCSAGPSRPHGSV